eukprot:768612-Hanusia_phi.AAC.1
MAITALPVPRLSPKCSRLFRSGSKWRWENRRRKRRSLIVRRPSLPVRMPIRLRTVTMESKRLSGYLKYPKLKLNTKRSSELAARQGPRGDNWTGES